MKLRKSTLIILGSVIAFALIIVIGCVAALKYTGENTQSVVKVEDEEEDQASEKSEEPEEPKGTLMFALFGVDSRSGSLDEGTRSDSIMLVCLDNTAKTVRVASIYRDCMVHIEGHNYEKITHAHSYGGPELAMETINENFDLNIENYVTVNFDSVADVVDEIGGIEQDITEEEVKYINKYIKEINSIRGTSSNEITEAGNYTLDGTQAVAYSRIRYTAGGDYKRSERQRTILFNIFDKAKELEVDERLKIFEKMQDEINTNYSSNKIKILLYYLSQYSEQDTAAFPQVFYGGSVDGAWVEVPVTLTDMASSIHEFFYSKEDYEPSDTVKEYSGVLSGKASEANTDLTENQ